MSLVSVIDIDIDIDIASYIDILTGPLPGGVDVLVERKAIFER